MVKVSEKRAGRAIFECVNELITLSEVGILRYWLRTGKLVSRLVALTRQSWGYGANDR